MKFMLSIILSCIFLIFSSLFSNSNSNDIRLYLDYSRFRYDEDNTYLEIYYLLYDLNPSSSIEPVDVWLEFTLSDKEKGTDLASEKLKVTLDRSNTNAAGYESVKGSLIKTVLPHGDYTVKMVRFDETNNQTLDSLSDEISSKPFKNEKITLSDLTLCSNIKTGSNNVKGLFYKNTMEVFPNPTHMYGPKTPRLYYYIEAYNIGGEQIKDQLGIEVAIADTEGKVHDQRRYKRPKSYESLVEYGAFDVSAYENGLYTLIFAVVDSTKEYSVYQRNNFMIMDPAEFQRRENDLMTRFAQSEYFSITEEEVDRKFDQIQYISRKRDTNVYKTLTDVEAKRLFMFKFWDEKEAEKEGLQSEYYERVDYANENYGFATSRTGANGWKSDRGRVYILYGEPDRIITKPSTSQRRPYEIWEYHELQGGGRFLFVDENGFGDFRLRSSTIRGELYDPAWDDYLNRPDTIE